MGIFGNMKTMRKKGDDKERFEKYQKERLEKLMKLEKETVLGRKTWKIQKYVGNMTKIEQIYKRKYQKKKKEILMKRKTNLGK